MVRAQRRFAPGALGLVVFGGFLVHCGGGSAGEPITLGGGGSAAQGAGPGPSAGSGGAAAGAGVGGESGASGVGGAGGADGTSGEGGGGGEGGVGGAQGGGGASGAGGVSGGGGAGGAGGASGRGGEGGTDGGGAGGAGGGGEGGAGGSPVPPPPRPSNPTCLAFARLPSAVSAKWQRVFFASPPTPDNSLTLAQPMALAQAPGHPERVWVAERRGSLVTFPADDPSDVAKTVALAIPRPVATQGEGGFLGFAFHPKFAENGYVYLSYTIVDNVPSNPSKMASVVARMKSDDGGLTFADSTYTEILGPFPQPFTNHNGGDAHFGTDGFLYLSFGDGGFGGDPLNHGQNKFTFFSKIVRIDVDNPPPGAPPGKLYGIPPGNPFTPDEGEPAAFAYGFRNPFRFGIDRATNEVWVGDVGQDKWEEIDAKVKAGGNYGWRFREGAHCFSPATNCPTAGLIDPVWEYPHMFNAPLSVTGGTVYRGAAIPSLVGAYVFGDVVTGESWALVQDAAGAYQAQALGQGTANWVAFSEDLAGEIYGVGLDGDVYKLVPAAIEPESPLPAKLSLTGCVDPRDPRLPAEGLIPFDVRSPLWSDGADKERYLAIPDDTTIGVGPDGDLDLPIGSVALKTFKVGGKRVETRLLVRHDDGDWAGYTYEWADDESDALLLPSSKVEPLGGGQSWYYPSRADCLSCHTTSAGRTLGLELAQLDRDVSYPNGHVGNQLAALEQMGLFDAPLGAPPPVLPDPYGPGDREARARSYLHVNCSPCHRPGTPAGSFDLRFTTPLAATQACGVSAQKGDLGVANAKLIDPGSPSSSVLVLRPERLDTYRMPPLATSVVDAPGTALLREWVAGLGACPPAAGGR
ncbi:MAG TPA: PQQ-dependent sugar dehydrogenase [Polyangiaceae bacterium]|nr:PQQ-dependent sugar dehydrogenase [Polyangiaceae bacterium]